MYKNLKIISIIIPKHDFLIFGCCKYNEYSMNKCKKNKNYLFYINTLDGCSIKSHVY